MDHLGLQGKQKIVSVYKALHHHKKKGLNHHVDHLRFYGWSLLQHVRMVMGLDINLLRLSPQREPYQQINTRPLHPQFHAFFSNLPLENKQRNQPRSFLVYVLTLFDAHLHSRLNHQQ